MMQSVKTAICAIPIFGPKSKLVRPQPHIVEHLMLLFSPFPSLSELTCQQTWSV